ncbi:hypothetical protein [uncultured Roseobacter sp.]|uniref:hypothetical protein n=1 Tax=uncultured Roseobacter sp. TaxID=114847 RepID=UPI003416C1FC
MTKTPAPRRAMIQPCEPIGDSAFRTVWRFTPKRYDRAASVGSLSPVVETPSAISVLGVMLMARQTGVFLSAGSARREIHTGLGTVSGGVLEFICIVINIVDDHSIRNSVPAYG